MVHSAEGELVLIKSSFRWIFPISEGFSDKWTLLRCLVELIKYLCRCLEGIPPVLNALVDQLLIEMC